MPSQLFSQLKEHLLQMYDRNPYVHFLNMKIAALEEGRCELAMPVEADKHTNLYNIAHGGALASLADTAMGAACSSLGKKVVTLDLNMNFIAAAAPQPAVRAVGTVVHNGRSSMVAEADIFDGKGALILKSRGTFFVVGTFGPELS